MKGLALPRGIFRALRFQGFGFRSSFEQAHLEPSSAAAGSSPAPVSSPDAGSTGAAAHLEVPSSAQIEDGSGGSDIASGHIAQGGAVGGDHISSAGSP